MKGFIYLLLFVLVSTAFLKGYAIQVIENGQPYFAHITQNNTNNTLGCQGMFKADYHIYCDT